MESLIVPLATLLIEHPQWAVFVNMTVGILVILMWRLSIVKMHNKLKSLESSFKEHATESSARGQQIETIKDIVMELKGIIAGMGSHNRRLK